MQVVVQADVHRFDIVPRQQLAKIFIQVGDAVFSRHALHLGLVDVAYCHDFHIGHVRIFLDMYGSNLTGADQPYSNGSCTC